MTHDQCIINFFDCYEYYYSPYKLAYQNTIRVGDEKLMIMMDLSGIHGIQWTVILLLLGNIVKYKILSTKWGLTNTFRFHTCTRMNHVT